MPKGILILFFKGLISIPLPEGDPYKLSSLAGPTISGLSQILYLHKCLVFLVNFKACILKL